MTERKTESYQEPASGIESAARRLEQALHRVSSVSARLRERQHSLKEENEKLNLLLTKAYEKLTTLKNVTENVSERLDKTILLLEESES